MGEWSNRLSTGVLRMRKPRKKGNIDVRVVTNETDYITGTYAHLIASPSVAKRNGTYADSIASPCSGVRMMNTTESSLVGNSLSCIPNGASKGDLTPVNNKGSPNIMSYAVLLTSTNTTLDESSGGVGDGVPDEYDPIKREIAAFFNEIPNYDSDEFAQFAPNAFAGDDIVCDE